MLDPGSTPRDFLNLCVIGIQYLTTTQRSPLSCGTVLGHASKTTASTPAQLVLVEDEGFCVFCHKSGVEAMFPEATSLYCKVIAISPCLPPSIDTLNCLQRTVYGRGCF